MARVEATVYGSESSRSCSRNGTKHPNTLSTASPKSATKKNYHYKGLIIKDKYSTTILNHY